MHNFLIGGIEQGQTPPAFNSHNQPVPWELMNRGRIQSIIGYTGGKYNLVKQLVPLLEWAGKEYNLNTFVTATGGACRCLLNLDPSRSIFQNRVYSDVDYSLSSLFYVLGDEYLTKQLINRLSRLDYNQLTFKAAIAARERDDKLARAGKFEEASDYVTAAANTYIAAKMSYVSGMKSFTWPKAVYNRDRYFKDVLNLHQFNSILNGVTVFRQDCRKLIREIEKGANGYNPNRTMILADVPYDTDECRTKNHYAYSWNEHDHINYRELIKYIESLMIICGYESRIYDVLIDKYPERWQKVFLKWKHVSSTGRSFYKDEWIYVNFKISDEIRNIITTGEPQGNKSIETN